MRKSKTQRSQKCNGNPTYVVYFGQLLGAVHFKRLSKSLFLTVFCAKKLKKMQKSKKFAAILKNVFLSLHQNAGQVFYSQKQFFQRFLPGFEVCSSQTLVEIYHKHSCGSIKLFLT